MARRRVAVLHLDRATAMGERRRVQSWMEILRAAGVEPVAVGLTTEHGESPLGAVRRAASSLRGSAVPESLAWDARSVAARLRRLDLDAVICMTSRAFDPVLAHVAPVTVLDYVDALSRSYADRAALAASVRERLAYSMLSRAHRRFERRPMPATVRRVAAGYADAARLGAEWIPIVAAPPLSLPAVADEVDVLFVGTLRYAPNVAALHRLARLWPALLQRRPHTTALIAGAAPSGEIVRLCRSHGWELQADFDHAATVYGRGRVAVSPLEHTAGIQTKVLDAATFGVAQVVSAAALEGLAPGFPVRTAESDDDFVDAIVELLDDAPRRRRLAEAAAAEVRRAYTSTAWAPSAAALLGIPFGEPSLSAVAR